MVLQGVVEHYYNYNNYYFTFHLQSFQSTVCAKWYVVTILLIARIIEAAVSFECPKTKTITLTNKHLNKAMSQSEFKANVCNQHQARENLCDHVMVGFSLVSHWLRNWKLL